jgi:hypothetical protein
MTSTALLKRQDAALIFGIAFLVRVLWALLSGLGPEAGADFERYDQMSDNILSGNFNLETKLFIVAPLFPYTLALAKLIFGSNWFAGLGAIQILISSASVVCLAASAALIFRRHSVAMTAGLLYATCLPTLYYTQLPSQESLFQSFFVIAFYGLCLYNAHPDRRSLLILSAFFTLALLTKSHVILMIPFICTLILIRNQNAKRALAHSAICLAIIGLLTMPYGLYNLKANGTYVISSSGSGGFFVTAHNDDFYEWLVHTPPKGTPAYRRLADMQFAAYTEDGIPANASHKLRQSMYLRRALGWVARNPWKALNLRFHNLWHHLQPGYSLRYQTWRNWAVSMTFNLPIYTLAYIELLRQIKTPRDHLPAYAVFTTMLLFVLIFYAQNRFRLITVEPIYVLYAAPGCVAIGSWIRRRMGEGSLGLEG